MSYLETYQNLISSIIAIVVAFVTAIVIWKSAKLPVQEQIKRTKLLEGRQKKYACYMLSRELRLIQNRAKQIAATIKVYAETNCAISDKIRMQTKLSFPSIVENWEFMSLVPDDIFNLIIRLHTDVDKHNHDMNITEGAFGSDSFRRNILMRITHIGTLSKQISDDLLDMK